MFRFIKQRCLVFIGLLTFAATPTAADVLEGFQPFGIELGKPLQRTSDVIKTDTSDLNHDVLFLKRLPKPISIIQTDCGSETFSLSEGADKQQGCFARIHVTKSKKLVYRVEVKVKNASTDVNQYLTKFSQALRDKYPDVQCKKASSNVEVLSDRGCIYQMKPVRFSNLAYGTLYISLQAVNGGFVVFIEDEAILKSNPAPFKDVNSF